MDPKSALGRPKPIARTGIIVITSRVPCCVRCYFSWSTQQLGGWWGVGWGNQLHHRHHKRRLDTDQLETKGMGKTRLFLTLSQLN